MLVDLRQTWLGLLTWLDLIAGLDGGSLETACLCACVCVWVSGVGFQGDFDLHKPVRRLDGELMMDIGNCFSWKFETVEIELKGRYLKARTGV